MQVLMRLGPDLAYDPPEGFDVGWPRYLTSLAGSPPRVSDVLLDLCVRAGLEPEHVDARELAEDFVDGYVIAKQDTVKNCIAPLCQSFYFDGVESSSDCDELGGTPAEPVQGFLDTFTAPDGTLGEYHAPDRAYAGFAWYTDETEPDIEYESGTVIQGNKLRTTGPWLGSITTYIGQPIELTFPYTFSTTLSLTSAVGSAGEHVEFRAYNTYDIGTDTRFLDEIETAPVMELGLVTRPSTPTVHEVLFNFNNGIVGGFPGSIIRYYPTTAGEHDLAVYVELDQLTLIVDGVVQEVVPYDNAHFSFFDKITPGMWMNHADSVAYIDRIEIAMEAP